MTDSHETTPIDKLRALGEELARAEWPDYLAYGINDSHIPELVRLALEWDKEGDDADYGLAHAWAPIHAWRALGQLRAADATAALLSLLHLVDDRQDDWVGEDLPEVFGLIGAPALPALVEFLADATHGLWARAAAVDGLEKIGDHDHEARTQVIAAATLQLERFAEQDPIINANLIHLLGAWKVTEAAPLIERAFEAERVDLAFQGDWEDVQVKLGLKEKRDTPRPPLFLADLFSDAGATPTPGGVPGGPTRLRRQSPKSKSKSRRKQSKKSQRKNRRKK